MKLKVYDKDKGYHLCIGRFYGSADYSYVQRSWSLISHLIFHNTNLDDRLSYELFRKENCVRVEMTALEFRLFISMYLRERSSWHPALEPYIIDTTHWKFKSLKKSSSNKILEWVQHNPEHTPFIPIKKKSEM